MMGEEGGPSLREGGGGNMAVVREARAGVAWMLTGAEEVVFRWRRLVNLRGRVEAGMRELEGMLSSSSSKAVVEVVVVARTSLKRLLAGVALTWMEGRRDCFLSSGRGVG